MVKDAKMAENQDGEKGEQQEEQMEYELDQEAKDPGFKAKLGADQEMEEDLPEEMDMDDPQADEDQS